MLVEGGIIVKGLLQGGLLGVLNPLRHHGDAEFLQGTDPFPGRIDTLKKTLS